MSAVSVTLFTTPGCVPCRTYKPSVEQLAQRLGIQLQVVNAEAPESARLVGTLGITNVPTVVIFRDGAPVDGVYGPRLTELETKLAGIRGG